MIHAKMMMVMMVVVMVVVVVVGFIEGMFSLKDWRVAVVVLWLNDPAILHFSPTLFVPHDTIFHLFHPIFPTDNHLDWNCQGWGYLVTINPSLCFQKRIVGAKTFCRQRSSS
jgi:hypothetical protein